MKVRAAREKELKELERRAYVEADVEECMRLTGKNSIGVRWVDVDKGFGVHRIRLVTKDFRPKSRVDDVEGLYAATPPLGTREVLADQRRGGGMFARSCSSTLGKRTGALRSRGSSTSTCLQSERAGGSVRDFFSRSMGCGPQPAGGRKSTRKQWMKRGS